MRPNALRRPGGGHGGALSQRSARAAISLCRGWRALESRMTQTVFLVIASKGSYDDAEVWTVGIFTDQAEAERIAVRGNREAKFQQKELDEWGAKHHEMSVVRHPGGGLFHVWSPGPALAKIDTSEAEREWREAFEKAHGPRPPEPEADAYTVQEVPLNQAGRFNRPSVPDDDD